MNDNYAVINGKRIKLTDEQVEMLGVEKRKNPFERVNKDENYYFITSRGAVLNYVYINDMTDRELYHIINYFNDKQFAEQVALHQLLYRKLLKFAYDNECEDNQIWGGNGIEHWTIRYNFEDRSFEPDWSAEYKYGGVYFSDREGVKRAINEVVIPFMKEHPDFVW
uniref:Uncharacterized protein n=1 Tax=Siphoviridae sp. ctnpt50 TaxID=2827941 RepID=A0A8S5SE40_9CAUD|nr:MAG TPA: hypothetical protein [Siphoviridae sp. ctnpt50]